MHGFIIVGQIKAKNVEALNKSVVSTFDVDGGGFVSIESNSAKGNEVWTASKPATGSLGGLWIAYNPEVKHIVVNGKAYAGLSSDVRDYTNVANKVYDAFKPEIGDIVIFSEDAFEGSANAVVDDFIEAQNGKTLGKRVAEASGATAGSTAFQIVKVFTKDFPKAGVGVSRVKMFEAMCVQD